MRASISDQDLTDYALNELPPRERVYVESMLGVSEECRNDVYEMIDLGLLLEEGFEREEVKGAESLTPEQRQKLLRPMQRPVFRPVLAALLAAAACAALIASNVELVNFGVGRAHDGARRVANVSGKISRQMLEAVNSDDRSESSGPLATWKQLAEDPVLKNWFNWELLSSDYNAPVTAASSGPAVSSWDSLGRPSFDVSWDAVQ